MLGADLEIVVRNPEGVRLGSIDKVISCEYGRSVGYPGSAVLSVNLGDLPYSLRKRDTRIGFWRDVGGGRTVLDTDTEFLVRGSNIKRTPDGTPRLTVRAVSAVDLLRRRIVAYAAGSSRAEQTGPIDDIMKTVVRENLGASATDVARRLDPKYFTVATNDSLGVSITKAFARRNVLELLRELMLSSLNDQPPIFFDVVRSSALAYEFRTYAGQRGIDRSGGNAFVFSSEHANLSEEEIDLDAREEVNVAYAGGQGQKADRAVVEYADPERVLASPFNRCEAWVDSRDATKTSVLTADAKSRVRQGRSRIRVLGRLLSVPGSRYGVDWGFGDKVKGKVFHLTRTVWLNSLKVTIASSGDEQIEARIEGLDASDV